MLFNSYSFIFIFLPITLGLFSLARSTTQRIYVLGAASVVFYADWRLDHTVLLVALTLANYMIGKRLIITHDHRLMTTGVAANIGVICYFKYTNFLFDTVNQLIPSHLLPTVQVALPLGISFFIFQKIAFLVDCQRGKIRSVRFTEFFTFVWFFPQLLAGPIVHFTTLKPQFSRLARLWSPHSVYIGLCLFSIGLFKKTVLADSFHPDAAAYNLFLSQGGKPAFLTAWFGVLCFSFQIYFDFSGYSDMAIGLARMFGLRLPTNFWSPYQATSIIDFWRRWHMSLSAFLRTYVYIPLGGNRFGPRRRYANLMATMLLGGLWHGAGWNFVAWGGLHGLYLCIAHLWRDRVHGPTSVAMKLAGWAITFAAVNFAWAFFQADSLAHGLSSVSGLLGLNGVILSPHMIEILGDFGQSLTHWGVVSDAVRLVNVRSLILLVVGALIAFTLPNSAQILHSAHPAWRPAWTSIGGIDLRLHPKTVYAIGAALIAAISIFAIQANSPFIYYNF